MNAERCDPQNGQHGPEEQLRRIAAQRGSDVAAQYIGRLRHECGEK